MDRSDALERLFEASALVYVSKAHHESCAALERAPNPAIPSPLALSLRIKRARKDLSPNVRVQATHALSVVDGFLRGIAKECSNLGTYQDTMGVAARFGVLAASLVREEVPRSTLEMSSALTTAYAQAQVERDAAVLAATPPGYRTKATSPTTRNDKGTIEWSTEADYDARHGRWKESTTTARQERIAFTDLLVRREKGRKEGLVPDVDAQDALAERVEKLIDLEQQNAARWKNQLAEKPTITVEGASVADPPSTPPEPMRSGPTRSDPTVAPSAPTAAPHATPAPSMPPATPSAPGGAVVPSTPRYVSPEESFERDLRQRCQTWIANSGRRTIEEAQACVDAQRAAMSAIRSRYHRGQEAERNWRAKQSRGPMPVPSVRIPWPASRWFRQDRDGAEADYAVRIFKWILDDEPKEQKR